MGRHEGPHLTARRIRRTEKHERGAGTYADTKGIV